MRRGRRTGGRGCGGPAGGEERERELLPHLFSSPLQVENSIFGFSLPGPLSSPLLRTERWMRYIYLPPTDCPPRITPYGRGRSRSVHRVRKVFRTKLTVREYLLFGFARKAMLAAHRSGGSCGCSMSMSVQAAWMTRQHGCPGSKDTASCKLYAFSMYMLGL